MAVKLKGSVRPRGDKFEYVIDVGKNPITKKRIQETGTCDTQEEAEQALFEINRNLRLGHKSAGRTFKDFIMSYYESVVRHKVRATTYEKQMEYVLRIIKYLGNKKIDKITYDDIEDFYSQLLNVDKQGKGVIRNISAVLRKTFKYAMKKKAIIYDVSKDVAPYSYKPKKMTVWQPEQVSHFLKTMRGTDRYAFYALVFSTGMRIGEILALYKTDILKKTNQIKIEKALKRLGKGFVIDDTKTPNSIRTLRLPKHVVDELLTHSNSNTLYLFELNGKHFNPRTIRNRFYADTKIAGLPRIRFHDIRHTVASILLMNRHPIVAVAELLGDTVQTVNSTYSHFIPKMESELVETITSEFFKH
ncbi:tyrosine-type recombinase/integrase [Paenibacillus tyrfis]|uniref:Integrase n=1 Tax=Paenibacillus tyrfis TaxID=1501230 RepID=A0A081NWM4_9BACL|nr:site-specific integrase [Paenibacillus tyrfis]KEQ22847.1 hypothetical protein ET33_21080 [Paenibacillus tyrfis]